MTEPDRPDRPDGMVARSPLQRCWHAAGVTLDSRQALIVTLVIAAMMVFAALSCRHASRGDGENLIIAVNLLDSGTYSHTLPAPGVPVRPSSYREPLVPFITAGWLAVTKMFGADVGPRALDGSTLLTLAVLPNLLWVLALFVLTFRTLFAWTRRFWAAIAGIVFLAGYFVTQHANNLYTELHAAVLLLVIALLCRRVVMRPGIGAFALLGVAVGLMILVKAAFLYIAPVVLLAVAGLAIVVGPDDRIGRLRAFAVGGGFAVLAAGLVVAPWVLRNASVLGSPHITNRGGIVLYTRAVKDGMTADERIGALYFWAPRPQSVTQRVIGLALGIGPADFKRGQRFQHLNREPTSGFREEDAAASRDGRPDRAISYFYRAGAEKSRLVRLFAARHHPDPNFAADTAVEGEAEKLILARPGRHVAMSLLFLYRGAFWETLAVTALLGFAAARRRWDLIAFAVPLVALLAFYSLLTHFKARYSFPTDPAAIIAAVTLIATRGLAPGGRKQADAA